MPEFLNAIDPISVLLGEWASRLDLWSILLRIALSILFAAIIGWERSTKRHAAGLRTFMLVSLASTMGMILDLYLITVYSVAFPLVSASVI